MPVGSDTLMRRIVKLAVYVLYFFLFAELMSRGLLSVEPLFRRLKDTDDSSRRLEWVKRHGSKQSISYDYAFEIYSPTRSWAVKPGLRDLAVFGNKVLNSNSRGIRGKTEYDYSRQPGRRRIVVLGDSYTFGDEVSDDETYSSDLATLLPNTEVLNLGVSGYGHDQMLLYLKEEGAKYHPDVVILGYVWFDTTRNLLSFGEFAKPRFELTRDGLVLTHVPVPAPEAVLSQEFFHLKFFDLALMTRERIRWQLGWNHERAEVIASAIFDELLRTTRDIGALPVFVYLPVIKEIEDSQDGLTQHEEFLSRYCRQRNVPCLFLRPLFAERIKNGATFNTRSHWLAPEHMLAAKGMRDFLADKIADRSSKERHP